MPPISTCLWFDTEAEDAAKYYCSIFPNSEITATSYYNDATPDRAGQVLMVEWSLDGNQFQGINGGPQFTFDEAVSLSVRCKNQDEVDSYWTALTAEGGSESQCGWCKDKYGLSWQIVPQEAIDLFEDPDRDRASRAIAAMMKMQKIDVAEIRRAADDA